MTKSTPWQPLNSAPKDGTPVNLGRQKPNRATITPSKAKDFVYARGTWLGDYGVGYRAFPCPFTPTHWRFAKSEVEG